jgi:hypothetical protein
MVFERMRCEEIGEINSFSSMNEPISKADRHSNPFGKCLHLREWLPMSYGVKSRYIPRR